MGDITWHLRIALRMLWKRRGLTVGRTTTVTVVVAAVTAVITVAGATLLRPLPFPNSDRLMQVYLQPPGTTAFTAANPQFPLTFARLRERVQSFERLEGQWVVERAVTGDSEPESLVSARISAGYFDLLGGMLIHGRTFTEEEVADDVRLVVLSHGLWTRRFGGDAAAVGKTLLIDREPHTIIGIVARSFVVPFARAEFWTPLPTRGLEKLAATRIRTFATLRADRTADQAGSELAAVFEGIRLEAPQMLKGWEVELITLRDALFGTQRPALYMLLAAVAALALVAMANLANLTLADVMHRRMDFVIRAALGGRRSDIAAPEVTEALLLAAIGGAAGLAVAAWLIPLLLVLDPSSQLTPQQLAIDWRIAVCGFAAAAVVMLVAVAAPVLRLSGGGIAGGVAGRRTIGSASASRLRLALVAAQTALALVLLSVGSLVAAAFYQSARTQPGFDPAHVLTAQLRLPESVFRTVEARAVFIEQVLARLRAVPGVVNAATTMNPFATGLSFQTLVHIEDRPTADGQPHTVQFRRITPGYFQTLRIPLLGGRDFDTRDTPSGQPVAIVSRGFADRFWPLEDPVGKRIRRGTAPGAVMVVGVVDDVRDISLEQAPIETLYVSVLQTNAAIAPVSLVVRTAADPHRFVAAVKRAVWEVDAKQPLANIVSVEEFLASTLGPQRFRVILVAACGLVGLALAVIGIYGVTARSVTERTREVGIRLALGGSQRSVWWTITGSSLGAVAAGAVIGGGASAAASAWLATLLPELQDGMGRFSVATGLLLVLVGAVAAGLAARRATTVDPVSALAAE